VVSPFDPKGSEGAAGSVFRIKGSEERKRGFGNKPFSNLFELKGADAPVHYKLRFGSVRGDAGVALLLIIAVLFTGAFVGAWLPEGMLGIAASLIAVPFGLFAVLSTNYAFLAPVFVLAFLFYFGRLRGMVGGGLAAFATIAFFALLAA